MNQQLFNDAGLVFRREFFNRVRSPMFLASLAVALFMIGAAVAFAKVAESESRTVGLLGDQPAGAVEALPAAAEEAGYGPVEFERFDDRESLEAAVLDGSVDVGVVDGGELVVETGSSSVSRLTEMIWQQLRFEIEPMPLTELDPDPTSGAKQAVGTALVVLLFLTIQLVGAMLSLSITEEKGNNIVELLLSSMSAKALLLGKLAANGLLGLIQVVVLIGAGILAVNLTGLGDLPPINPALLIVALVWFVVGFAFFGVLIAAGAALAPSQEDAQSVQMPVFILVLMGYFGSIYIAASPDGAAARIISFLPFISPFVMPARYLDGDLPLWEHALVLGVAVVSLVVVLQFGARIYTRSVIHTDRKLGWLEAFRSDPVR